MPVYSRNLSRWGTAYPRTSMRLLRKEIRTLLATPRPKVVAGQEIRKQQAVLDTAAQLLVLLAGRAHDRKVDKAALTVQLQIHHCVHIGKGNGHVFSIGSVLSIVGMSPDSLIA